MSDVQGSSTTSSQQKLDALYKRDGNAETVRTIADTGKVVNVAQLAVAADAAAAQGALRCFAGRVLAPLAGAYAGAWFANAVGADRPVTWLLNKAGLPTAAKPGKAPAHKDHKIVHENAFLGAVEGLLLGIAAGAAIALAAAAIVATGGAAAAVLVAAGPAVIGFVAGAVGGFVGAAVATGISKTGTVKGWIAEGSPNVSFEGKPVARVTDTVTCADHPGPPLPQIAQGSKTISVNGLPLARIGHKITCSANIQEGCNTISADETTGTFGAIDANLSILQQSVLTIVDVLMMRSATKQGGLLDRLLRRTLGEPIDMATGDYADYRTDFTWPHVLPVTLTRVYAGREPVKGLLGDRWICNWSQRLEYNDPTNDGPATVTFFDADGQQLVYPVPHEPFNALNLWAPYYVLRGTHERAVIFDERKQQSLIFELTSAKSRTARLSRIEDRNGNSISFVYNILNRLCEVRHSAGFELGINCDADGILRSVSERRGAKADLVRYEFTGERLSDVWTRFGGEFHFGYTVEGWLNHWRDSGPTAAWLSYDARGRVIATRTNTALYDDRFEYNDHEHHSAYIDARGHRHEQWFDPDNRLIRLKDPLGRTIEIAYDEYGWLQSQTDPLGRQICYSRDGQGRVIKLTNQYGHVSQYRWDDHGQPLDYQSNAGIVRWNYNAEGNLVALNTSAGETRWRYDPQGQITQRIEPGDIVRSWEYDEFGHLSSSTDPLGRQTRFIHDHFGRLVSHTDVAGHRTGYSYQPGDDNPREALSHVEYPDQSIRRWRYDQEGMLREAIDPLGNATHFEWGAFDLLSSVTDPAGASTRYHRDGTARLTGVTNALGQHWTLTHDAAGHLVAETDWNGRTTRYERNALGQVVTRHLPDGTALHHEYDQLDRLIAVSADEQKHTFVWDDKDRLVGALVWQRARDGAWTTDNEVRLTYDEADRLVQEIQHGQSLQYGYDGQHRLRSLTTPSGETQWQYDKASQIEALVSNGHRFDFSYDLLGRETQRRYRPDDPATLAGRAAHEVAYPEGYVQFQTYDAMRRLESQTICTQPWEQPTLPETAGQRGMRSYRWDPAGRCTQMVETSNGFTREGSGWHYDARGQITHVRHHIQGGSSGERKLDERYAYDDLGNISQQKLGSEYLKQAYEGDEVVEAGPNRYRYDALGRLTERTEYRAGFRPRQWRYRWDTFGRLREVLTPDGEHWRYRYDAFGRRISKACLEGSKTYRPSRVDYLWQGSRLIEAWRSFSGKWHEIQRWHYRPGSFEALAQERLRYEDSPDPARSEWYAIACDPNGAPHTLYNSEGRALWRARLQLWGQSEREIQGETSRTTLAHVVADSGLARQLAGSDDRPDCELRFAGQWEDEESGLHYNLHRYYEPRTAQYLSPDPIRLAGGLRTRAYVRDPLQWCDPRGLAGCPLTPEEADAIVKLPKADRPNPETYLPKEYIDQHLSQFANGAARIQPSAPTGTIGRTETWVMPRDYVNDVIAQARGNPAEIERLLGLDPGYLGSDPVLVNIPEPVNVRMPTGREFGANDQWIPGGFTSGGVPEAVIDPVPIGAYSVSPIPLR